jgi:ABC-type glycerol-3-phosphate transport system substrate-binding protein
MRSALSRLAFAGAVVAALSLPAFAADTVTLTFWHNHPEWKARVQKILDKFQAENPGIVIQLEEIPGPDYTAKMNTALAAGEAPDIIELRPGPEVRAAAEAGYIVDLTGKVDMRNVTQSGVDAAQIDGKTWAVPMLGEYTVGLYYHKDIFAANNLTPPKTADELLKLCPVLKAKGIAAMIAPSQDGVIPSFLYALAASSILGPDGLAAVRRGERKLTDPDVLKAAKFLQDLYPCFEDGAIGTAYVEGKALFALGKGAMMEGGSADYAGFSETNPKVNLGVVPFPALAGGKGSTVTGMEGVFAINSQTKDKDAAIKFLNWMLGDEPAQMVVDTITLTTNKNVKPSNNETMKEMVEASKVNDVRVWYEYPEVGDIFTVAGKNSQALFLKEMTPEEFAAALQATVDPKAK